MPPCPCIAAAELTIELCPSNPGVLARYIDTIQTTQETLKALLLQGDQVECLLLTR